MSAMMIASTGVIVLNFLSLPSFDWYQQSAKRFLQAELPAA